MSEERAGEDRRRTAGQLILNLDILLCSHAKQGSNAIPLGIPVREPAGGRATGRVGRVSVGHDSRGRTLRGKAKGRNISSGWQHQCNHEERDESRYGNSYVAVTLLPENKYFTPYP